MVAVETLVGRVRVGFGRRGCQQGRSIEFARGENVVKGSDRGFK